MPSYAPPGATNMQHFIATALRNGASQLRIASEYIAGSMHEIANRIARPRCVYPGCSEEVGNWTTRGYVPIDSDLCDTHHHAYDRTYREWGYTSYVWSSDEMMIASWADWHHRRPEA